eukprot:680438_1
MNLSRHLLTKKLVIPFSDSVDSLNVFCTGSMDTMTWHDVCNRFMNWSDMLESVAIGRQPDVVLSVKPCLIAVGCSDGSNSSGDNDDDIAFPKALASTKSDKCTGLGTDLLAYRLVRFTCGRLYDLLLLFVVV